MIFALTGCRRTTDTVSSSEGIAAAPSSNTDTKIINLLYSYSDTFNPYTASTDANRNLTTLLYDPLVKTDNSFKTVYALASSAQTVEKVCTVKLRDALSLTAAPLPQMMLFIRTILQKTVRFTHIIFMK